jgi:hypothetical protein
MLTRPSPPGSLHFAAVQPAPLPDRSSVSHFLKAYYGADFVDRLSPVESGQVLLLHAPDADTFTKAAHAMDLNPALQPVMTEYRAKQSEAPLQTVQLVYAPLDGPSPVFHPSELSVSSPTPAVTP